MLSTGSSAMSMMAAQQSDAQAQQTCSLNIWSERHKTEKDRIKTLEGLRDAVAKIDAEIHKNRAKTAQSINKDMQQLLISTG
ncbi:MAG TPA: hypothetical protein PL110_15405 [Candidatus Eremiobacteraeota bacterium]|nr:MAG: hypothetical protein BWY64_01192 [bacterium ADurb.Bin363]HPZ09491.1 hypothetical protein [Candidatus Eremiobacteraeota bacterium]